MSRTWECRVVGSLDWDQCEFGDYDGPDEVTELYAASLYVLDKVKVEVRLPGGEISRYNVLVDWSPQYFSYRVPKGPIDS